MRDSGQSEESGGGVSFSDPLTTEGTYLDTAPVADPSQWIGGEPAPQPPPEKVFEEFNNFRSQADDRAEMMNNMLLEYERLLAANPSIPRKPFGMHSDPLVLANELNTLRELLAKPFHYEMYDLIWGTGAGLLESTLASTPTGAALAPNPTPENPRPRTLKQSLTSEKTLKKVRPIIDDLFNKYPLLKKARDLNSPEAQLFFIIFGSIGVTYRFNTDPQFRQDVLKMEQAGFFM